MREEELPLLRSYLGRKPGAVHTLSPTDQLLQLPGPQPAFYYCYILELQVVDRVEGWGSGWIGLSQTQQLLNSSGHSRKGRVLPEEGTGFVIWAKRLYLRSLPSG